MDVSKAAKGHEKRSGCQQIDSSDSTQHLGNNVDLGGAFPFRARANAIFDIGCRYGI